MGISLLSDSVTGVAGTTGKVIEDVGGLMIISELDDGGSSTISGISRSTLAGASDTSIEAVDSSWIVGRDEEPGKPTRSLSFVGDCEEDLERTGVFRKSLKSMWGISWVTGKIGTDRALPFIGDAQGVYWEGGGLAVTVDMGFLDVVLDRLRVRRFAVGIVGSDMLRVGTEAN